MKVIVRLSLLLILTQLLSLSSCQEKDEPLQRLELSVGTVAGDSIQLTWSQSQDSRFDSYELYRNNNSGLDDENGTFIHVSTEQTSTSFTDHKLAGNQTYYYRLYHVITDDASIGSNVVNATTPATELINNGSFESVENNSPVAWNLVSNNLGNQANSIEFDTDATEGAKSLKIHHADEMGCWEQWISQKLDLDDLEAGQKYVISFDYKADFNMTGVNIILRNSGMDIWDFESLTYQPAQAWQKFTYELILPASIGSNDPDFRIHFCQSGIHDIWIDNVSMKQSD